MTFFFTKPGLRHRTVMTSSTQQEFRHRIVLASFFTKPRIRHRTVMTSCFTKQGLAIEWSWYPPLQNQGKPENCHDILLCKTAGRHIWNCYYTTLSKPETRDETVITSYFTKPEIRYELVMTSSFIKRGIMHRTVMASFFTKLDVRHGTTMTFFFIKPGSDMITATASSFKRVHVHPHDIKGLFLLFHEIFSSCFYSSCNLSLNRRSYRAR